MLEMNAEAADLNLVERFETLNATSRACLNFTHFVRPSPLRAFGAPELLDSVP